jgi:hypothetical protein
MKLILRRGDQILVDFVGEGYNDSGYAVISYPAYGDEKPQITLVMLGEKQTVKVVRDEDGWVMLKGANK